ncbi:MAG: hypothetical protein V7638_1432 [Acidobacteriota bacterium]
MDTRQQIIANALRQRYDEVRKTASQPLGKWSAPVAWFQSKGDSLSAIRALAKDEELECIEATPPDESEFFDSLQATSRNPQRRFELLTTRYLHPLNIAAPSEHRVREHLLERLMVADRARIEQHSLHLLYAGDLLLRLNLIAIYASLTTDLRYLDALNYYYELLPSDWYPQHSYFLNFYLRALASHIN